MFNDWFTIGSLTVHGYGVMTALGLLAALFLSTYRAKKKGLSDDICYGILFVGVIFGYMGSKALYLIVEWDSFIANPKLALSSGGFVVLGGLTTGVIASFIYCKIKKVRFIDYFDLVAPGIAAAQCLGRIGCFFAGCCYGKETDSPIGITFTNSSFAPNGVKLIPTQLISSAADLVNMFLLLFIAKKAKKKGIVAACYVIFYSVGRFFIEYLRDDDRGTVGFLSTSQFYSVLTLLFGIGILVWALTHREKEAPAAEEVKNEAV